MMSGSTDGGASARPVSVLAWGLGRRLALAAGLLLLLWAAALWAMWGAV